MRALIVDDNADIRLLLQRVLAIAGLESAPAAGGREALEMLVDGEIPAVVILDVQMPVVDGWETLRAIRAMPLTRDVPVIMCTVKGGPVDMARGRELGADGYVTKPFDVKELIAAVRVVTAKGAEVR